jgi:ribosome-associated toxin RatA of RatAB toxin-antitoxin module
MTAPRVFLTALLMLPATSTARPALPAAELARLERQTLIYSLKVPGSGVMMAKAIRLIPESPRAVLHVLLDVASYKHFLPRVKESRVTRRAGAHTFAVIETSFPWPAKDAWVYIDAITVEKPGGTIETKWKMVNGTMKSYTGHALIEPWTADGKQSVLTYAMQAEPKISVPDSMISEGVRRVVRVTADRIALRLEALRKFGKLPRGI